MSCDKPLDLKRRIKGLNESLYITDTGTLNI